MAAEPRNPEATMDAASLYREEIVTDRKVGTIRMLVPITTAGVTDASRPTIYAGEAQIMTNMGALPVSFDIDAANLAEAVANYGEAARAGIERTMRELQEMRRQASSGLIVPPAGAASALAGAACRWAECPAAARSSCRSGARRPPDPHRAASASRGSPPGGPIDRAMTETAILAASGLLLFAYAVEHFGRHFKLPAVVLLIVTGLVARQALDAFDLHYRWVEPIVPVIGTIGLILIVLEGALDLTVTRERRGLIVTAATASLLGFAATLAGFGMMFHFLLGFATPEAVLAAIPFAVISSAVAIPSAAGLAAQPREFVVYESSLSDILGVLVFYSWLSAEGSLPDFALDLFGGGALSLLAAVAAAIALYYFISQIVGHVRFLPLLAGLVFLYAIGKVLHLSPLIVILVCGLADQQPASRPLPPEAARAAQRRLRADAEGIQGPGRRAHVRDEELLLPAARLLDRRAHDAVGRGVAGRRPPASR